MEKLLCFAQTTALVLLSFMIQAQGNVGKTGQSDEIESVLVP